ncbi:GIY-YIG nuclease family protein [Nonomuraea sp. NPDC050536]|uniref:GIY-YIG nuclease family protein n=1 Tax=Nonomuraea sp. NPDC050536 TaxID=3364366 RepID=UPI0037CC82E4
MADNARVCWQVDPEPWTAESELIAQLDLPLNLDQNRSHAFHQHLSALRASARVRARELPIACWTGRPVRRSPFSQIWMIPGTGPGHLREQRNHAAEQGLCTRVVSYHCSWILALSRNGDGTGRLIGQAAAMPDQPVGSAGADGLTLRGTPARRSRTD